MSMSTEQILTTTRNRAVEMIDQDVQQLLNVRSKLNPEQLEFCDRVIRWYSNSDKNDWWDPHQSLWEMFNPVLSFSEKDFADSFYHFLCMAFLKLDTYYSIEWHITAYDDEDRLIWLPDGNFKTEIVEENDPRHPKPLVVRKTNYNSKHSDYDAKRLMYCMDRMEQDSLRRKFDLEEIDRKIQESLEQEEE